MGPVAFHNQRPVWKSNIVPSSGRATSDKADWINIWLSTQRIKPHCSGCLCRYRYSSDNAVKVPPPWGARVLLTSAEIFNRLSSISTGHGGCDVTRGPLIDQSDTPDLSGVLWTWTVPWSKCFCSAGHWDSQTNSSKAVNLKEKTKKMKNAKLHFWIKLLLENI